MGRFAVLTAIMCTDSSIYLHICIVYFRCLFQTSSLTVSPFFVENINELQLNSLKLVTNVSFSSSKYLLCFYTSYLLRILFSIAFVALVCTICFKFQIAVPNRYLPDMKNIGS